MVRVLITGGAGYVGAAVTAELLNAGHHVTVLDSLEGGGQGLLTAAASPAFRLVHGDVRDGSTVQAALQGQDAIVHLAAIVGFLACRRDPDRAESVNVQGTLTLLRHRARGQLVLFASTGSVYGAVAEQLCHEALEPRPLSVYGRTKLEAERLVLDAGHSTAFRFATAFGLSPRMRADLLINGFVRDAHRNGYVVIYDKDARRTFIHVRDMARAFLFALERFGHAADMDGRVFNAGSETLNVTKEEIAQRLCRRMPFQVFYGPVGTDEDRRDYAVSYARLTALGYRTTVSLDEGLDELVRAADLL
jgi:nucleoside-diphosphate-sugar epimerase